MEVIAVPSHRPLTPKTNPARHAVPRTWGPEQIMQSAGRRPAEIRDAEHESGRGRFVPTVPVGHTLYTTEEDKIMSERDGYGPVVPWWVAATRPTPESVRLR